MSGCWNLRGGLYEPDGWVSANFWYIKANGGFDYFGRLRDD